jgi:cell division protein ZapA
MSNVTLSIGGRQFTVACAEGEEAHVASLGQLIDGKLADLDGIAGQTEGRMLLFAALLLADEVHEARQQGTASSAPGPSPERLHAIAQRIENLAIRLEQPE